MALFLIVSNDSAFTDRLATELRRRGVSAQGVQCETDLQTWLASHEVGLIIFDCEPQQAIHKTLFRELVRDYPVVVLSSRPTVEGSVETLRLGAVDYLEKPSHAEHWAAFVDKVLVAMPLHHKIEFLKVRSRDTWLVGESAALMRTIQQIQAVASSDMTVLITGESGVGKELVAHKLHLYSARAEHPFVVLDCCGFHDNLFESELFGYERGAFTGATQRKPGLIESAEGGTLFLDEIGETSPNIQAKLLRVLETGHFRRLGGIKDLLANVRIISATNRDLQQMLSEGYFRKDLFYRLSIFVIAVPPLRERREDIPSLVEHFIRPHSFSRGVAKTMSPAAMDQLLQYPWPGNVRELKNVVERGVILAADNPIILPEHIILMHGAGFPANRREMTNLGFNHEPSLAEIERQYLQLLLDRYQGHRGKVARVLGISERQVYRLIKRYGGDLKT